MGLSTVKEIRQLMDSETRAIEATAELNEMTQGEKEAAIRAIEQLWGRICLHFGVADLIPVPNKMGIVTQIAKEEQIELAGCITSELSGQGMLSEQLNHDEFRSLVGYAIGQWVSGESIWIENKP